MEVPIKRTQYREVEKPIYVEKVVEKPVITYIDKPYDVEKRVNVNVDVEVEKEIYIDKYVDEEVE